jgi:thiol:disulfide interchange protein
MSSSNGAAYVVFQFHVPPDHVLYAERLAFQTADGQPIQPLSIPNPVMHHDQVSGEEKKVYDTPFAATLKIDSVLPLNLLVKFQGCSNSACYFPERHPFTVTSTGIFSTETNAPAATDTQIASLTSSEINTNGFKIGGRETGFMPKKSFLAFLQRARTGAGSPPDALDRFNKLGPAASLLLIVLGGIGLNLTPCVLPLIPINLAIIGAGARASSRRRGFALGATYGLGMTLVYGVLGLIVVLTGSKFGALNSSAWFNLGIAAVFLVMCLAMFDLINVDFSRFQSRAGGAGNAEQGQFVIALSMGVMAALLAGACVAPVVISVLLLATHLYGKGIVAGLLLPFLLGFGMALPWPFAGAGLSFLPKPGKWMKWVKYSFGLLILLFAGYYGHLAYDGFQFTITPVSARASTPDASTGNSSSDAVLISALQESRTKGQPLFIDFAASWCKNCLAMDKTVFPSPEVKQQLKDFIVVRYDAEKPNDSPAREVLNQFGVVGLPTYVVLLPEN